MLNLYVQFNHTWLKAAKKQYFILSHISWRVVYWLWLMHNFTQQSWTQVLRRFKFYSRRVGDLRWWRTLTMVPAGNKVKCLSSVNHATKTIHHHHPILTIDVKTFHIHWSLRAGELVYPCIQFDIPNGYEIKKTCGSGFN